jgi:hypothetical protein
MAAVSWPTADGIRAASLGYGENRTEIIASCERNHLFKLKDIKDWQKILHKIGLPTRSDMLFCPFHFTDNNPTDSRVDPCYYLKFHDSGTPGSSHRRSSSGGSRNQNLVSTNVEEVGEPEDQPAETPRGAVRKVKIEHKQPPPMEPYDPQNPQGLLGHIKYDQPTVKPQTIKKGKK